MRVLRRGSRNRLRVAPVNGLKMYYEIQGSGEPVVVLHGAFMAITTHVTLMDRMTTIVPMVNDFLDAKP